MRIISRRCLREFWCRPGRADSSLPLRLWYAKAKSGAWKTPADLKRTFGANVDFVKVASGNTLAVFDIGGNKYRLIAAVHYDFGRVFVLRVLTHREYDFDHWKAEL
jgi:mRNA interferase HigB